MDTVCPIDVKCASQIAALLRPPSPLQVQEYYEKLIAEGVGGGGLQVKQNGDLGKGVYANLDFEEGELVLKDQMLVGSQHPSNKIDCLVCSFCFCFIGSIELQIGRKLYLKILGVSTSDGCDKAMHIPKYHCTANEKDNTFVNGHRNLGECASSGSGNNVSLPNEVVQSLLNGEMLLPYSNKFPLAPTVACPGGCAEAYYCSKSCAEADWESSHSLLCTGQRSESLCRKSLLKFVQHATETNDIFLLAAKTIAFTLSRYRKLKAAHLKEQDNYPSTAVLPLLLEAWKPISVGYKRRWWDCVSLPEDVDYSDETAFRMEIRDLAFSVRS